jgi:hypothetical protein
VHDPEGKTGPRGDNSGLAARPGSPSDDGNAHVGCVLPDRAGGDCGIGGLMRR